MLEAIEHEGSSCPDSKWKVCASSRERTWVGVGRWENPEVGSQSESFLA